MKRSMTTTAPVIAIVTTPAGERLDIVPRLETGLWAVYERDGAGQERRAPIEPKATRRAVTKALGDAYDSAAVMTMTGMRWFMDDPDGTREESAA